MRVTRIYEPQLQFGTSSSVDVRNGVINYCVADFDRQDPLESIRVGIIGSQKSVERFCAWLERCKEQIEAKESRQPNLFPLFPGFNSLTGFRCELRTDSSLHRVIRQIDIETVARSNVDEERKLRAVDIFIEQARDLFEKRRPDVLVCALPDELLDALDPNHSETPIPMKLPNKLLKVTQSTFTTS